MLNLRLILCSCFLFDKKLHWFPFFLSRFNFLSFLFFNLIFSPSVYLKFNNQDESVLTLQKYTGFISFLKIIGLLVILLHLKHHTHTQVNHLGFVSKNPAFTERINVTTSSYSFGTFATYIKLFFSKIILV